MNIMDVCSRKKIKIVSFDVFDTLIKRIVPPNQLYHAIENKLQSLGSMDGTDYAQRRIESEKYIASKKQHYSLNDIYSTPCFDRSVNKQLLMQLEKQYEINNVIPNASAKRIYDAVSGKIPIVCVSDMYLDSETIGYMLNKNGYGNILKLYVSNECGASKRQGDIWKLVCKEQDVAYSEILHIGDAVRSDYAIPKMKNVKTIHFKKNEWLQPSENYYYNLGFSIFGPILYKFCNWIYEQKTDEKLLFLSREGEFIEKCYKLVYPYEKTEIMYVSRDAVAKGIAYHLLQNSTFSELFNIMSFGRIETVEGMLKRLGLNSNEIIELFENNGINSQNLIDDHVVSFMENHKNRFMDILKEYNQYFDKYIEQMTDNKNAVIDVGWTGSMQNMISKYLESKQSEKTIKGLYLGVDNNINRKGFLYEGKTRMHHQILNFSGLIEVLFMPNHGSVRRYMIENGEASPVIDISEMSEQSMKCIADCQEGVYSYIRDALELNIRVDIKKYVKELINIGCSPKTADICKLGRLEFYENGNIFKVVENGNIFKTREFLDKFVVCKWKTAFLKKNLHIKLPYSDIVIVMRIMADKIKEKNKNAE